MDKVWNRVAGWGSVACFPLLLWSYFGGGLTFFVSPSGFLTFVGPALVVCVVLAVGWARILSKVHLPRLPAFLSRALIPLLLGASFGFVLVAHTLPTLAHLLAARPHEFSSAVLHIGVHRGRSQLTCYRVDIVELDKYWFGKICPPRDLVERLNPGDVVQIEGTRSWFGFDAQSIVVETETFRILRGAGDRVRQ